MEQEMVSTPAENAPAFLQLRDKYKQDLAKAADLAAKQHVLLASDVPDAWKRPHLKGVGRQLRHWTKKVRQPFSAPVSGVGGTGDPATPTGEDEFDANFCVGLISHAPHCEPADNLSIPLRPRLVSSRPFFLGVAHSAGSSTLQRSPLRPFVLSRLFDTRDFFI